jgi:NTP pyrophosphatase (non-canonical NTP hydrolase)
VKDLFGEREDDLEILSELESRIEDATKRYGAFASTHEALGVAYEEWGELREAIHANALDHVRRECLDLAAVLIRLARAVRGDADLQARSVK